MVINGTLSWWENIPSTHPKCHLRFIHFVQKENERKKKQWLISIAVDYVSVRDWVWKTTRIHNHVKNPTQTLDEHHCKTVTHTNSLSLSPFQENNGSGEIRSSGRQRERKDISGGRRRNTCSPIDKSIPERGSHFFDC